MTAPESRRRSWWHEGIFENGYYDLWQGDNWRGWTNNTEAAITWVITGEVSPAIIFLHEGMRAEEAAEIIMNHQLDGADI